MTQPARLTRAFSSSSLPFSIPCWLPGAGKRVIVAGGEMTRVHPNASTSAPVSPREGMRSSTGADDVAVLPVEGGDVEALTVWRKSLLFNGNGFTVFDPKGNLVFRVDNYASGNKGEIVLMDAAGKPLLTIRRKKLSLGVHWLIYNGEESVNPLFSVKKHVNLVHSKTLAHISPCPTGANGNCAGYDVEGSYSQRCCVVYDSERQQLAEIRRKEAAKGVGFGLDVFRLIIHPGINTSVAMAIVILLEQMFGSRPSFIGTNN